MKSRGLLLKEFSRQRGLELSVDFDLSLRFCFFSVEEPLARNTRRDCPRSSFDPYNSPISCRSSIPYLKAIYLLPTIPASYLVRGPNGPNPKASKHRYHD